MSDQTILGNHDEKESSVRDYTKAARPVWRWRRWRLGVLLCALAATGIAAGLLPLRAPQPRLAPRTFDFSGWHFPVPAGDWLISRGPCGGGGLYTHQCGYFEDECAYDLTPVVGTMMSVPVLAPQAGQVFFLGTRTDSGLGVLLQHEDGRISALMHLSKAVVGLDQRVAQGQVIGYAGSSGSSTRPHLHFDVQPNAVERSCLPLSGIDETNMHLMTVHSHNLAWRALVLPDPPPTMPAWLPLIAVGDDPPGALLPARVVLAPSMHASVPVAVANKLLGTQNLYYDGALVPTSATTSGYTLFSLPLSAPNEPGDYQGSLEFRVAGPVTGSPPVTFNYAVREPVDTRAGAGLVWINPRLVGPPDYSILSATPRLCYTEPAVAGPAPLTFRVIVSGSAQADSGWTLADCWTPPTLAHGTFFWKVFVRDGQGHMNRTNDRPHIFRIQ
jgi:murein DD-endopeptidase MepM/ murein hydrolase activator NlpD